MYCHERESVNEYIHWCTIPRYCNWYPHVYLLGMNVTVVAKQSFTYLSQMGDAHGEYLQMRIYWL